MLIRRQLFEHLQRPQVRSQSVELLRLCVLLGEHSPCQFEETFPRGMRRNVWKDRVPNQYRLVIHHDGQGVGGVTRDMIYLNPAIKKVLAALEREDL